MIPILFALISYIGWGAGDIFGALASRKVGPYAMSFWGYVVGFILSSLYAPFVISDLQKLTFSTLVLNVFLGILLLTAFVLFNTALKVGNVAVVGTITASFASLVVLLSIVFLGENINFQQLLAILFIFIGIIFSSLNLSQLKDKSILKDKGIILAILTLICWGAYFTFIKIPISQIGWFWPNYISLSVFPLLFLYIHFKKISLPSINYQGAFKLILLETLLVTTGTFGFNIALSQGLTAIVAPIAGAYPTLFVFLAFLVFKDPITRQQIAGIITTLIGIVLLSFLSV